jgi:hypothetical protein
MKARTDLTPEESRAFVAAFERAINEIPTVRTVRIGQRVRHIIDFDNLDGLQAYLAHPAHVELGELFYSCLSAGMVYDYEVGSLELLSKVMEEGERPKR